MIIPGSKKLLISNKSLYPKPSSVSGGFENNNDGTIDGWSAMPQWNVTRYNHTDTGFSGYYVMTHWNGSGPMPERGGLRYYIDYEKLKRMRVRFRIQSKFVAGNSSQVRLCAYRDDFTRIGFYNSGVLDIQNTYSHSLEFVHDGSKTGIWFHFYDPTNNQTANYFDNWSISCNRP